MNDISKTKTLRNNPTSNKIDQILSWNRSFNLKIVLSNLFWFAFMTSWLVLLINHGKAFLSQTIPAFLIISFILIIRLIEKSHK